MMSFVHTYICGQLLVTQWRLDVEPLWYMFFVVQILDLYFVDSASEDISLKQEYCVVLCNPADVNYSVAGLKYVGPFNLKLH